MLAYGKGSATKGVLCLEGNGLAYGKGSATKGLLCLEWNGLAYGKGFFPSKHKTPFVADPFP